MTSKRQINLIFSYGFIFLGLFLILLWGISLISFSDVAPVNAESKQMAELMLLDEYKYDLEKVIVVYEEHPDEYEVVKVNQAESSIKTYKSNNEYSVLTSHNRRLGRTQIQSLKNNVSDKLEQLLDDSTVLHAQPVYYYEATWTSNGSQAFPDDYDEFSDHWYYELEDLSNLWYQQGCHEAMMGCGGSRDVVVAVLDTGLAYADRTDKLGFNYGASADFLSSSGFNLYTNSGEDAPGGNGYGNEADDDGNGIIDDYNGFNAFFYSYCKYEYGNPCIQDHRVEAGYPNDKQGHGTFVTGNIASVVDNALGSVSPAFKTTILPIKVSSFFTTSIDSLSVKEALDYARKAEVDIINMSFGGPSPWDQAVEDALERAADAGIILVAATGNNAASTDPDSHRDEIGYPAAYEDVIAVGAVTYDGTSSSRSSYSQYGCPPSDEAPFDQNCLDVTAYVGDTTTSNAAYQVSYSCYFSDSCPDDPNSPPGSGDTSFQTFTADASLGTSFAAPQVSAIAALIKSTKPNIEPDMIKPYILDKATLLSGTGTWGSETGWGAIDFSNTISELRADSVPTLSFDSKSTDGHRTIEFDWSNVNDATPFDVAGFNDAYHEVEYSFYLSEQTDSSGLIQLSDCSGYKMSESTSGTCSNSVKQFASGSYYLYSCLNDKVHSDVCYYDSSSTVTFDHTNIDCGPMDYTASGNVGIADFADFASVYKTDDNPKVCQDDPSAYGSDVCGPKDTDGDNDVDIIDFAVFAEEKYGQDCT
jgi:hypothetical protein